MPNFLCIGNLQTELLRAGEPGTLRGAEPSFGSDEYSQAGDVNLSGQPRDIRCVPLNRRCGALSMKHKEELERIVRHSAAGQTDRNLICDGLLADGEHHVRFIMRALSLLTASIVLVGAANAFAQDKRSQDFLVDAIQGNLAEIQMGELAEKNGQSGQIINFGETLKTQHADANKKARAAANSLNVTAPTEPSAKQKSDYEELAKLKGPDFDKKFASLMVMDHQQDIEKYNQASRRQDAAGRYATDALPTLQKHLETALKLEKDTGATGSR